MQFTLTFSWFVFSRHTQAQVEIILLVRINKMFLKNNKMKKK